MIEACREYMHLGGQLPHSKLDRIPAPTAALLVGAEVSTAVVNPMGSHSEVVFHTPRMPNIVAEGGYASFQVFHHVVSLRPRHISWLSSKEQKHI